MLFCVPMYVCLWSGTFQPSLCNLLCLASQPFWSWVGHMNLIGRGHQVSLRLRLEPCTPCHLDLDAVVGVCAVWAELSMGGQGALGLSQELLRSSQSELLTAPYHEKTLQGCRLLNICAADPACAPTGGRENTYFCPSWEIWGWIKKPCMLI